MFFRAFSKTVYYIQGTILSLAVIIGLYDHKSDLEQSFGITIEEFEALASGSNAGSLVLCGRLEKCFVLLVGVLLLTVAYYVPVEQRAVPSLAVSACLLFTAHEEYLMSTNSWLGIQVFQGTFTEVMGAMAVPLNDGFGLLHLLVSIGTFLGLANDSDGSKGSTKRD
eukprot:CAMPEP_0113508232 /NCGR_PEP_ID=MMETSP0014_2-20120614/36901_1 /TAXON_ID=2857 /ORGANISM="Nitzschia sp." /LENGTH=166 /DNA_ID=CAMNT_0000403919 /DNA_START=41 /DNA_END=542 /DNA_ORIENTATION=+ /assembly_acc=CAM_ASM_000159